MDKTKICTFCIVFLLAINAVAAVNIDMYPTKLYFNQVLSGGYAEKTITITTDSENALYIIPSISGIIRDWISLSPNTSLRVSKKLPLELKAVVRPPKDTSKGTYSGHISLNIINKKAPEISVDKETSLILKTVVEITDKEIKKLSVKDIFVSSTEQNHPIDFFITILNEGNKEIKPIVKINLENIEFTNEITLLPFEEKEAIIDLDIKELELGKHTATISVFLDGILVKDKTSPFTIFEKNSLIRKGILLDISNKERVHINDKIRIDSKFYNIGEVSVDAQFKGQIYFNNGVIEEIESEEVYAPVGKITTLSSYFIPHETGKYKIIGEVYYSNTVTEEKESFVDVLPQSESLEVIPLGVNYAVIVFLIIMLLIVTNIYLRKKVFNQENKFTKNIKWK